MKKLLLILLCMIMCVAPLASCSSPDDTTAAETTASETTGGGTELPSAAPVYETRTLAPSELGYTAQVAKSDNRAVADVVVTEDGGVAISSHKPGVANITVQNSYSEVVEIKATVAANGSFTSVEFDKFEMPENWVMATEFGVSPYASNNTPYLQAAIDSLAGGGTVYIPKGIYNLGTRIVFREGIILRLEGCYDNYNTELNDRMLADMNEGRIAVLVAGSQDMFISQPSGNPGRNGADNFALYGGMLDMKGSRRCFVLTCVDGVTIENTIMKDCANNHAIQVTGSKNVTLRNCMFAGYNLGSGTMTRETIQIEESSPQAIGGTTATFDNYEYYFGENVVIENCYFGKSDEYGYHLIPIGHHGHALHSSVTGLDIINCTFVNPMGTALRLNGYSDVEIAGCKFVSDTNNAVDVDGDGTVESRYMIELTFQSGDITVNSVCLAKGYERRACNGVNIHDNEFYIGSASMMAGAVQVGGTIAASSTTYSYDAQAESNLTVSQFITTDNSSDTGDSDSDADKDKTYTFTGYKMVYNRVSDLLINNNTINVENTKSAYVFHLSRVKGYQVKNNSITAAKALTNNGLYTTSCTSLSSWQKNFVVNAKSANTKPIVMMGGETNINAYCTSGSPTVTFNVPSNGKLERWADYDGNLYVKPVADNGYVFDGYYVNSTKITAATYNFSSAVTIEARFVAK